MEDPRFSVDRTGGDCADHRLFSLSVRDFPGRAGGGGQGADRGRDGAGSVGLAEVSPYRVPAGISHHLPPLGNDFVAMVKDSSLVSVLGVSDITQLGKVTAAGNFRYFETYNVVALVYLTMTISLSLVLRRLETRLKGQEK